MSKTELARRLGVTYQAVQSWEREPDPANPGTSSTPTLDRLADLARVLQVTPEWILTGVGPDGAPHDPVAAQLVRIYSQLPDHLQEVVLQHAESLLVATDPTRRSAANPYAGKRPPTSRRLPDTDPDA